MTIGDKMRTMQRIHGDIALLLIKVKPEYFTSETQEIFQRLCENSKTLYLALSDEWFDEFGAVNKNESS